MLKRNRAVNAQTVVNVLIALVALVAVGYVAWLLVTSAGLGTFPLPADEASDAAKVGSYMIRFGLVIIALSTAVLLGAEIVRVLIAPQQERAAFDWVAFMKALADLIKTPAGIGFGVVILGIFLLIPTVFAPQ